MNRRQTEMLEAALKLARQGLRVVPLYGIVTGGICACGDIGCKSPGKHPWLNAWANEATTDETRIKEWFSKSRELNIGIATGPESGVFVLDEDGSQYLRKFTDIYGELPQTLTARSARGRHHYFNYPRFKVKTKGGLHKSVGIDVRGDGGLIVAPPSMHKTGVLYEWEDAAARCTDAPDWFLELLSEESKTGSGPGEKPLQVIPDGRLFVNVRKRAVFELSAALYEKGNSLQDILRLSLSFNRRKCSPELEAEEVRRLIGCAAKFVDANGTKEDSFKRRRNLLPWSQNRREESLTKPRSFTDYQRGWLEYFEDYAWINGAMLPTNEDTLFRLAHATQRKKFATEKSTVLADFKEEPFDGESYWVHQAMAEEWADAAVKWTNKSITSRFTKAKTRHSHTGEAEVLHKAA